MQSLNLNRDVIGNNAFSPPISDYVYSVKLAANTDTTLTVPADAKVAMIGADANFYVDNAEITVPTGASFVKQPGMLNRSTLSVTPGDVLHFISETSIIVTVAFYSAQK